MFAEGVEFITSSQNRYEIVKAIGKGAFGTVFLVKRKLTTIDEKFNHDSNDSLLSLE